MLGKISQELNKPVHAITPEAMDFLKRFSYPGNVRQLANILEYACILCNDTIIRKSDLPVETSPAHGSTGVDPVDQFLSSNSIKEIEMRAIQATLKRCGGKRSATADALGISKRGLLNKLKEFGIAGHGEE